MRSLTILICCLIIVLMTVSCNREDNAIQSETDDFSDVFFFPTDSLDYLYEGDKALIMVVENNNTFGFPEAESLFETRRAVMGSIFSELYEVDPSEFEGLTLIELIDQFGEPWQIEKITEIAEGNYDRIIALTDSTATSVYFLDSLNYLKDNGYSIDIFFNLHGTYISIVFVDGNMPAEYLCGLIVDEDIDVRSVYQCCCYASRHLPEWAETDVQAVCGATDINYYMTFSPIFFFDYWLNEDMTYGEAVRQAFYSEVCTLYTLTDRVPELSMMLLPDIQASSEHVLCGDSTLLWPDWSGTIIWE